ncbi:uncharacterized protein LOC143878643 [Tasmannia lanceolata]|uniref:uncharacterized protein LOC143878643 n=1 Tax=Tasmannia lanceolata TaxID=3420 RepID=UPI004062AA28
MAKRKNIPTSHDSQPPSMRRNIHSPAQRIEPHAPCMVLTNGDEVKLQRNALSVIEVPREEEIYDCGDVSLSGSDLGSRNTPRRAPTVDLRKLETAALWRYWRHFKLDDISFHPSKEQLVEAVERHFLSQQLDEFQVIAGFVNSAKRLKQSVHGLPD